MSEWKDNEPMETPGDEWGHETPAHKKSEGGRMKCELWIDGKCHWEACSTIPCPERRDCRWGWLPYWTPSERAGLKAIGKLYRISKATVSPFHLIYQQAIRDVVRVYVSAVMRVKGGNP